jgi:V/A-type H+-transporting ATPase subunit D
MSHQVKATRMELQKKKKNYKMAVRGHKLLKEKRDGLMQRFLGIIRDAKRLRESVEEKLQRALRVFLGGTAYVSPAVLDESLSYSDYKAVVEIDQKNMMGVKVPGYTLFREGKPYSYGFAETDGDLDLSLQLMEELVPFLMELAHLEKAAQLLAEEIESTRRRVNALEYVMIPDLESAIAYISMRLDELERSKLTMLMKIKEIVAAEKQATG